MTGLKLPALLLRHLMMNFSYSESLIGENKKELTADRRGWTLNKAARWAASRWLATAVSRKVYILLLNISN
ncbi:hypothetical protein [Calothrix sp. NIES-2098]|uniref:hypothetical protein n=1 Tax=Calothrix sp. NIES-2098 TaxID=1954171 RepID=UPI0030D6E384